MSDFNKDKMVGAAKVVGGVLKIAGGVSAAFGKGIVGHYMQNHGLMKSAPIYCRYSVDSGKKMINDGLQQFRNA